MSRSPFGVRVDLDPGLARELSLVERRAAQVHVLRARADELRGPAGGERALLLAIRASEIEAELLAHVGVEKGAEVMRRMADHPATVAAVEQWRYAQRLARQLLDNGDAPEGRQPGEGHRENGSADGDRANAHVAESPDARRDTGPVDASDGNVIPLHSRRRRR